MGSKYTSKMLKTYSYYYNVCRAISLVMNLLNKVVNFFARNLTLNF